MLDTYLLRKLDDQKPTCIMREMLLPSGEIWQWNGYLLVPPELANRLGPPDDEVTIGAMIFPAWRMDGEMPDQDGMGGGAAPASTA